ncbi:MAG: MBL fold metallo-hydrolase [Chloroflexi bacterium]|nr:MBL fold metallo-hydrolase [Chloroflexota bacterium]
MLEEILPGIYKNEIPLPRSPLKALNSYIVRGQGRFLIIDTGMNREECMKEMASNLQELGVDLKKTDFFITHLHADHLGLVARLATDTSTVYFNKREASIVGSDSSAIYWRELGAIYESHGFSKSELEKAISSHPGQLYGPKRRIDFYALKEGDNIDVGDYSFRCIETPGHSPGHMCLYESSKKILVAGDHILFDITPNVAFWPEMDNSLKEYLASLDKVYPLDVNLVLPGHRNVWSNHRKRITELQEHHQARLKEVLAALEKGEKTAFQVAPHVSWDIKYSSWELFPAAQKWFAVGETVAHLEYLENNGKVKRRTKEQRVVFSLV